MVDLRPGADVASADQAPSNPPLFRRAAPACLILLAVYIGVSLLNDPHGYLGTDTGGKVATLQAMHDHGGLNPDVGYWAERWDPTGRLHPLYYTYHLDGKWVNATTLPALYLAYPLYELGGYRATLLIPMLGALMAALAARALARRISNGGSDGWAAFWLVGLASPLTIYALDLWEHTLGVGLVAWGVVLLYDFADAKAGWRAAAGAGLLFGLAATMRTEALVYGAVATAVFCGAALWRRRQLLAIAVAGVAVLVGLVIPLAANQALEQATIGSSLRAQRATGTVQGASGDPILNRLDEAVNTATSLGQSSGAASYLLGGALLALLILFAVRAGQGAKGRTAALGAAGGIAALYLIRAVGDGLGFVPGLIAAAPLAAVGLALGWGRPPIPANAPADPDPDQFCDAGATVTVVQQSQNDAPDGRRLVLAVALLALPLVWALQFTGGAAPQWGARYILPSGLLLTTLGAVSLPLMAAWARRAVVGLAVGVTCFGLAWLSVRSHDAARASQALSRRAEPVLVSRIAHMAREGGEYANRHRWLTAISDSDEAEAARVVTESGLTSFGLVELDAEARPHEIAGFTRAGTTRFPFLPGVTLRITTYATRSGH